MTKVYTDEEIFHLFRNMFYIGAAEGLAQSINPVKVRNPKKELENAFLRELRQVIPEQCKVTFKVKT